MDDSQDHISRHVRLYLGVFVALATLTVLTVAASRMNFSSRGHVVVAMLIAALKASLVATVFMHLMWERAGWIWGPLLLCAVLFSALLLLPTLTQSEAEARATVGPWDHLPARVESGHEEGASGEGHAGGGH